MYIKQIFLSLLVIFMFSSLDMRLQAQVTIGSGLPPVTGSLLQLKEDHKEGANSTKGLLLPRLHLTSPTTLIDINGGTINQETLIHTGLTIFNLSETAPFCKRIYVWSGTNWQRLGLPCASYLGDLQDIDFGISAGDTRTISFATNASWQYSADANYDKVIASSTKALNTIHVGGTAEKEETISFNITSADFSPKAGSVQETKLTFRTAEQFIEKGTSIHVKRTVPSYLNVLSGTSGNIARITPTVSAQAESNDKWSITTFIDGVENQTATQDNAPLNTKTLSLVVPSNESWDAKNIRVDVKGTDANTGIETVKQNYNHTQAPWNLSYAGSTNIANPVPRVGGSYTADMKGDFPGPVKINVNGTEYSTAGIVTATPSAKNLIIQKNTTWADIPVKIDFEHAAGTWVNIFTRTQGGNKLNHVSNTAPNPLPRVGGNYLATMEGDFDGPVKIRVNDLIYSSNGVVTATPSAKNFTVAANNSWDEKNVLVEHERKPRDPWVGIFDRLQAGYTLNYAGSTNIVNPVPRGGGNYTANMSGDYTGTVNIRAAGNVVPTGGGVTTSPSPKKVAVAANNSWDGRNVLVEHERKPGDPWVGMFNTWQSGYTLNYAGSTNIVNPVPRVGGSYTADMKGDFPGPVNIRAAGNVVATAGGVTTSPSAKNVAVAANNSWDGRNVLVEHERKPGDPWVGMFNTWQSGYTLNYAGYTNMPDPIPAGAGNYVANFTGDFIGPVRIRTRNVDIYKTDGVVTATASNRSFSVPANNSWAARVIDIDFEKKNEQWNHFISRSQSALYWMNYIRNDAPNPIPYTGGWYQKIEAEGNGGPVTVITYINGTPSFETVQQYATGANLTFYVPPNTHSLPHVNADSWKTRQIDVYIKKQGVGGGELVHAGTLTQSPECWVQYSRREPTGGIAIPFGSVNLYVTGNAPDVGFLNSVAFRLVGTLGSTTLAIAGNNINKGEPVNFKPSYSGTYTIWLDVHGTSTKLGNITVSPDYN